MSRYLATTSLHFGRFNSLSYQSIADNQQGIPTSALVLGLCGLVPFIGTAVLVWWPQPIGQWLPQARLAECSVTQPATLALGGYGAVILSFLGGVRWGNLLFDQARLNSWVPLMLSVLPSLIAWPALLLSPILMLTLLMAGFSLQYALDVAAVKRGELPVWFGRLRRVLSTGAILSLLIGLIGNAV